MAHIALLGDSVIDNKAYVGGGPDVAEQLRALGPKEWKVTRLALDGAVTADVIRQLSEVPSDATHIIISAGGNDALRQSGILDSSAVSVGDVLFTLAEIQDAFRRRYSDMLDAAQRLKLPTAVCTVYDPRFPDPMRRRLGALALSVFNDAITREAFARGLDLLDLRVMFDNNSDFANPIEPFCAKGHEAGARGQAVGFGSRSESRRSLTHKTCSSFERSIILDQRVCVGGGITSVPTESALWLTPYAPALG